MIWFVTFLVVVLLVTDLFVIGLQRRTIADYKRALRLHKARAAELQHTIDILRSARRTYQPMTPADRADILDATFDYHDSVWRTDRFPSDDQF